MCSSCGASSGTRESESTRRCSISYERRWLGFGVRARGRGFAPDIVVSAVAGVAPIVNADVEPGYAHVDLEKDLEVNVDATSVTVDSASESRTALRDLYRTMGALLDAYPTAEVSFLDKRCTLVLMNRSEDDRISAAVSRFASTTAIEEAFPNRMLHSNAIGFHENLGLDRSRFYDLGVVALSRLDQEEPNAVAQRGLSVSVFEPFRFSASTRRSSVIGVKALHAFRREVESFADQVELWFRRHT